MGWDGITILKSEPRTVTRHARYPEERSIWILNWIGMEFSASASASAAPASCGRYVVGMVGRYTSKKKKKSNMASEIKREPPAPREVERGRGV